MAKTTGSFESLIRGVSQQVAHQRFPGQHWAQDNMISDPVVGLVRRAGSVMRAEQSTTTNMASSDSDSDVRQFKEKSLYLGETEYSIMYRAQVKPAGSTVGGLVVVDKTNRKLLPVNVSASDSIAAEVLRGGFSAVTSVGRFILLAARNKVTTYNTGNPVDNNTNGEAFIKQGNYNRLYTLTLRRNTDKRVFTAQYTTPTSYYPGTLNTSDIPATNPDGTANKDYQKLVNDRVYQYQTAVNQWIGTSAAAIVPANIAQKLMEAMGGVAGFADIGMARTGSTIVFTNVDRIIIDDSANGDTVGQVLREVENANDLGTIAWYGQTVRVNPKLSTGVKGDSYYLKARAIAADGTNGYGPVVWEEAAGVSIQPVFVTMLAVVNNGQFYMASDANILGSLSGISPPGWAAASSGDYDSQPLPAFLGKTITYMQMFQDRLMIVSGSTVFMSRSGDYFNFFKSSALSVENDDPIEVYALGSEDDIITDGAMIDRNLILFGNVWQYAISGREALTPTTAYVAVQSNYEDSNVAAPASAGNLLFFAQPRDHKLTVQQMQTGAYADTVACFEITQQLNSFFEGKPLSLVTTTSPSTVFMRTLGLRYGIYVFSYLDAPGQTERLFDAWHRWTWNEAMGQLVGITGKEGALLAVFIRQNSAGGFSYVLDEFSLSPSSNGMPHLDSMRPYNTGTTISPSLNGDRGATVITAAGGSNYLLGRPLTQEGELVKEFPGQVANMVRGFVYDSGFTLTNPYIRDDDGKAILDSRLVLSRYNLTLINAAAVKVEVQDLETKDMATSEVVNWVARPTGNWVLNTQQVEDQFAITAGVFREIRSCLVTIKSRSWLPFGVSAIEWAGQFFTRRR